MTAIALSTSSRASDIMNSQAARRYACDRCREQKLRCPRNQPGDNTCDRCLRVGAFCVTSSGRPLGRPPLHTNDANRGHVDSIQSSSHARRGREPWRRGRSISRISNPLGSPQSYSASTASGSDSSGTSTYAPPQFEVMRNMRLNESDFPNGNDASSSADFSLDSATSQPHFCLDSISVPELDFGNLGNMAEPQNTGHEYVTGDTDDNDSGPSESSTPKTPVSGDSMPFLIGVIGSISHQLAELKNQSWESWDPYQMRVALFDGYDPDFTCSGLNSWEHTLSVTMRFVLILQMMVPAPFSTAPALYAPPTLAMTLMLLSTYIQLGQLFDTILTRISNCLHEIPGHSELFSSAVPGATRRVFPTQPASFHVMMMMQVIEHQLQSVECLMGLPAECRHWSRKDACGGMLEHDECSVLTQAVMGQAQETFGSLKRSIERIRISLRGSSLSSPDSTRRRYHKTSLRCASAEAVTCSTSTANSSLPGA